MVRVKTGIHDEEGGRGVLVVGEDDLRKGSQAEPVIGPLGEGR